MKESEEMIECHDCGSEVPEEESYGAETGKRGEWHDVCRDCYDDIVSDCQLCGASDVMPSDVSEFIVVKHELAQTDTLPPGVYLVLSRPFLSIPMIGSGSIFGSDVLFIDRLPVPDHQVEISGHICRKCAPAYRATYNRAYRIRPNLRRFFIKQYPGCKTEREKWHAFLKYTRWGQQLVSGHIRRTLVKHPQIIRDLECSPDSYRWMELKNAYRLPDLKTYNEWPLLTHNGVTVYKMYQDDTTGDSWLTLRPEPKFRTHGGANGTTFCASSLPTCPQFDYDAPENKGHNHDHHYRIHSIPAIKAAIEQGFIRQDGTFDKDGKPFRYG